MTSKYRIQDSGLRTQDSQLDLFTGVGPDDFLAPEEPNVYRT
jgi:hypothetical protein